MQWSYLSISSTPIKQLWEHTGRGGNPIKATTARKPGLNMVPAQSGTIRLQRQNFDDWGPPKNNELMYSFMRLS